MSSAKQFLLSFLICLVVFAIIATNIIGYLEREIINGSPNEKDVSDDVAVSDNKDKDKIHEDGNDIPDEKPDVTYFSALLIGEDSVTRELDSLIVVSADYETKKVMTTVVPVETQYQITGSDLEGERFSFELSLREAYSMYGVDYLVERLSALMGLKMEYYAVANSVNAKTALNSLGRVSYNVPEDMEYKDIYEPILLPKGEKELDGSMAMQLLRYRSYLSGNGDSRRRTTQTAFVREFISQILKESNKTSLVPKIKKLRDNFVTNVTNEDIDSCSELVFMLSEFEFVNENFPVYATAVDESRVAELHDRFRQYR